MVKRLGVIAEMDTTSLAVSVTGTPGGAGVAVGYTQTSSAVKVTNTSNGASLEYKAGAAAWLKLQPSDGIEIPIDLSVTSLLFRRSRYDGGLASASLVIYGKPTLKSTEDGLPISSGAGVAATLAGTFAIGQTVTATLPAGVVGTLQFTRTLKASPFTKSLIAGAVANAVNSLSYTLVNADGGCTIGIDASNQVTPTIGGDVPAAPQPLRVATVNNHIPLGAAVSAGNDLFYVDYEFTVGSAPISTLVPMLPGAWYLDATTSTVLNTPGFTLLDLVVENAAGTAVVRFPFPGAGTTGLAVASGANAIQLAGLNASDIEPSLSALPRGYKGRIKGIVKASAAGAALPGCGFNTSGGQQFWTVTGNSLGLTDILTPGFFKTSANALPPSNGASGNNVFMPILLGTYANGADPMTWMAIGDSEIWGTGDTVSSTMGAGLFQRALRDDGTSGRVLSGLNWAVPGVKMDAWATDSRLAYYGRFCRGAIIDGLTNNFNTNGALTSAQAQAIENPIYPLLRAQGCNIILREDFLPRTTSTDAFVTEANQTYVAGWGPGGNVDQFRTYLTSLVGTTLQALISKAPARGTDPNKYPPNLTGDGTHGNAACLALIAPLTRTAMDAYA